MRDEIPHLADRIADCIQKREYLNLLPMRNVNGFIDKKLQQKKINNSNRLTHFIRLHKEQMERKRDERNK